MKKTAPAPEPETLAFATPEAWEAWLAEHHATPEGIWLKFFKKGAGVATVTYAQALDVALCYGWIDGQSRGLDATSYLQRFLPRRARSTWSKINRDHVARLTTAGRMKPPGLAAVEAARADGRWDAAYDSPANATVPPELAGALAKDAAAQAAFDALDAKNRYAMVHRLQTAKKPETRAKRAAEFCAMLARGEKLHP